MPKDDLKSEASTSRPRDEKGHFISVPEYKDAKNPLEKFLISHTGNSKDQDDILDIRVGNPFGRIIKLLEDIKRQKAFSFTLKGSLGIAGVALVISTFGLFGGSKLICDKGLQTKIGKIQILEYREIYSEKIPVLEYLMNINAPTQKLIKNRTVLVLGDNSTIYIPYAKEMSEKFLSGEQVIVTGNYDSCSHKLQLAGSDSVEAYDE